MIKVMFLIVSQILTFSCAHSSDDPQSKKLTEENPSGMIEDTMPMDLWSPDKRFSNALYCFFMGEFAQNSRHVEESYEYFQTAYNLDPLF